MMILDYNEIARGLLRGTRVRPVAPDDEESARIAELLFHAMASDDLIVGKLARRLEGAHEKLLADFLAELPASWRNLNLPDVVVPHGELGDD